MTHKKRSSAYKRNYLHIRKSKEQLNSEGTVCRNNDNKIDKKVFQKSKVGSLNTVKIAMREVKGD